MKLYRLIYLFILLVLAALCTLLIVKQAQAQAGISRYVSPWTPIQPGQMLSFQHQLGIRPLELSVWVMIAEKSGEDTGATIVPHYDLRGGAIKVISVGTGYIYIQNLGKTEQRIKVVAQP